MYRHYKCNLLHLLFFHLLSPLLPPLLLLPACSSYDEIILAEKQTKEFCQTEQLHITCRNLMDHVIIILSARYGRMKIGRCVKGDYGNLGCAMDALFYVDHTCSGETECRFRVFDALDLREKSPCPEDVAGYIEVTYACVKVTSANVGDCSMKKFVSATIPSISASSSAGLVRSNFGGLISSVSAQQRGIGSVDCPWLIAASKGLRFIVWLRYVSPDYREHSDKFRTAGKDHRNEKHIANKPPIGRPGYQIGSPNMPCYELATFDDVSVAASSDNLNQLRRDVAEGGTRHVITTCDAGSGLDGDEKEVLRSKRSALVLTMAATQQLKSLGKFFVRFQVIGCADMEAPYNSTIKRDGDKIMVKCNHSEHTWKMTCRNGTWIGDSINCNQGTSSAWGISNIFDRNNFPFGILVVVSSGVALGIFLGGLLLVCLVVYMKRQHELNQKFLCVSDDSRLEHHQMVTTPDVLDSAYLDSGSGEALQICSQQPVKRPLGMGGEGLESLFEESGKVQTIHSKHNPYVGNYSDAYPTCHQITDQTDYPASRSLVGCLDYNQTALPKHAVSFQASAGCHVEQGAGRNFVLACSNGTQFCPNSPANRAGGLHVYELPRVI